MNEGPDEPGEFRVVITDEGKPTVLAAQDPLPDGWKDEGFSGSKQECFEHLNQGQASDDDRGSPAENPALGPLERLERPTQP